jgi:hypothetical protein
MLPNDAGGSGNSDVLSLVPEAHYIGRKMMFDYFSLTIWNETLASIEIEPN